MSMIMVVVIAAFGLLYTGVLFEERRLRRVVGPQKH